MKIFLHNFVFLCAATLLAVATATGAWATTAGPNAVPREPIEESQTEIAPAFRIVGVDERPALRDSVRIMAMRARFRLAEQTSLDWEGTALIVWTNEETFLQKTGFRPENTAAAASARDMTIWINERAWVQADDVRRFEVMTHEVGHLLLGSLPGGEGLPLWVNEGIVMHLAGQFSYDDHLKLLAAHAAGSLPPLESLETEFPRTGESQTLAYRMSYAAVGVVAENYGDKPGEVRRLVLRLADPVYGPSTRNEFWDAFRRDGWQIATKRSLGSRFSTAIAVLTGTTSIFLFITILAVIAFLRVRRKNVRTEKNWVEDDEPWAESLTDEDVQDIYGDREERWQDKD